MGTSWQINEADLDAEDIYITVEPMTLKADQAQRIQQDKRLHALTRRHVIGRDLPIYGFRFKVHGPGLERTQRVNFMRALLRTGDTWRLTAPDEPNQVYFNDGVKEIDLVTVSTSLVYGTGTAVIALDVVALEPAPDDSFAVGEEEPIGVTRGVAQVFNGICFEPVTENVLFAHTFSQLKRQEDLWDAARRFEAVVFDEDYGVSQEDTFAHQTHDVVFDDPSVANQSVLMPDVNVQTTYISQTLIKNQP